jgi:hypothetical protein
MGMLRKRDTGAPTADKYPLAVVQYRRKKTRSEGVLTTSAVCPL